MKTHQAIRTKKDYEAALAEIERLLEFPEGSPEERELETVSILVEAYESANDEKIPDADPIEVLTFIMDQQGLTRADLAPMIGSSGRVSEVMTYKRPLTLAMMRALSEKLHIPIGALATDYKLKVDDYAIAVKSFGSKTAVRKATYNIKEASFTASMKVADGRSAKRGSRRISAKRK